VNDRIYIFGQIIPLIPDQKASSSEWYINTPCSYSTSQRRAIWMVVLRL